MANVQTHRPPTLSRPVTFIGREVGRYTVVRPLASGVRIRAGGPGEVVPPPL